MRRQDIYYGIREKTRSIADQHANLGRTVDGSIVQHLQKLRTEIKAHIKVRSMEKERHRSGLLRGLNRTFRTIRESLRRASQRNASYRPGI